MTDLVDKDVETWLDNIDVMTVDPLGRLVIEDKAILKMVSGGTSVPKNMDRKLYHSGAGCGCNSCNTRCK